ncbi:hypothetical protein [Acetivibrio cellulolyticus]|uniref:hypothetical protein n=1 Tax=Acetivibrio cellulolyticus TaxID=35830 RepID=UPI0001E2D547|nr:hypothetical protein [Acetivibrio cellulolyticus]
MSRFKDLISILGEKGLISSFEKISTEDIEREIKENPGVPIDYIDFLQEIGFGDIGNDAYFMFYSGLIPAKDIYGEENIDELRNILLLGDDFSGYCVGFMTSEDWALVEVDEGRNIEKLNLSFEKFAREKIFDYISNVMD